MAPVRRKWYSTSVGVAKLRGHLKNKATAIHTIHLLRPIIKKESYGGEHTRVRKSRSAEEARLRISKMYVRVQTKIACDRLGVNDPKLITQIYEIITDAMRFVDKKGHFRRKPQMQERERQYNQQLVSLLKEHLINPGEFIKEYVSVDKELD
jgi:hypothetical protein